MKDSDSWEYLLGVPNETEADVIIGLLEGEASIPVRKVHPAIDQFMYVAAGTVTWVELWVPKSRLEEARTILTTRPADPA